MTSKGWKIFGETGLFMDSCQRQDTKHEFRPLSAWLKEWTAQSTAKRLSWISRCFTRTVCFGRSRGGLSPSPDSPLSGTELHYLCRSGSKHPTETARTEDSEMSRGGMSPGSSLWFLSRFPGWKPCGWWVHMWGGDEEEITHMERQMYEGRRKNSRGKENDLLNRHIKYVI